MALVLVAGAVVLFVVLKNDDSGDSNGGSTGTTATATPSAVKQIEFKGDAPVGGVQDLTFSKGDQVRFDVTSNVEGEVHVHGYDIEKPIAAGGKVSFDFPADLDGAYEVAMHLGGDEAQIAELTVNP
ncbi:MAG: hypothetical protein ACXWD7_05985 [Solirubrobacterales bacterium]